MEKRTIAATKSEALVINKPTLRSMWTHFFEFIEREATQMRGDKHLVFTSFRGGTG